MWGGPGNEKLRPQANEPRNTAAVMKPLRQPVRTLVIAGNCKARGSASMRNGIIGLSFVLVLVVCCLTQILLPKALANNSLPPPTGSFAVGKVALHLVDESRIEPLSPNHEPREMMVDVWYPAESSVAAHAAYLDVAAYERALGSDGFRNQFRDAADALNEGVQTHAVIGAPYAHLAGRSAVLVFSPGGGMIREVYSTQLEDLASHGYVVAAISHSYDACMIIFPDGRQIAYSAQRWPTPPSLEGEANLNQLEWHAEDIRFVLDELTRLNVAGSSAPPFAGHLNLNEVGAFGHSFGGIAAAHACQIDKRFKACLNEDGSVAKRPFYLDVHGWGMDQAFMFILRDAATRRLSEEEVAKMKMTRQQIEGLVARLDEYQETALRNTGRGSYRVRLRNDVTTHGDFSDLSLLAAHDPADAERKARILAVVRSYTLAFFDRYLRGMKAESLDEPGSSELIEAVQKYAPVRIPCPPQ
jgi:hypothetical protein